MIRFQAENYPYTFMPYSAGDAVDIRLRSEEGSPFGDIEARLAGKILDKFVGMVAVEYCDSSDEAIQETLSREQVGIGANVSFMAPFVNVLLYKTLRGVMMKGGSFAYYYPEDVPKDSEFGFPKEFRHHALVYSDVTINGKKLFDENS